ncbi:uncharacterized protein LY79DRAFT_288056 [Colletotrichum navitas]|uniref:Uncharacterized protein n=1 Tax=Colletotrichum navitas TaxID=681940 RepID=A0AAD8VAZ4_9PEZI|nr:uncharacterized protein LY79DRAFT_288056 [Colletotrichum navitas]KAK1598416.1 hypothetical protein LY79DRAFT_288056 [Colletotrichum navitas]
MGKMIVEVRSAILASQRQESGQYCAARSFPLPEAGNNSREGERLSLRMRHVQFKVGYACLPAIVLTNGTTKPDDHFALGDNNEFFEASVETFIRCWSFPSYKPLSSPFYSRWLEGVSRPGLGKGIEKLLNMLSRLTLPDSPHKKTICFPLARR